MKILFAISFCGISLFLAAPTMADRAKNCQVGAYRLSDGTAVDIAPSEGDTLRWRGFTGESGQLHKQMNGTWTSTYGWTDRSDGNTVSFDCDKGSVTFGKTGGQRIPFDVSNTAFESGNIRIVGQLTMPHGKDKVPMVVLIHGSEHSSGIDTLFPAAHLPGPGY